MKSPLIFLLVLTANFLFAQGINFVPENTKWQDILAKAKAENKIVFVDCYTTWCGPCKKMAKDIFPLKEVGDVFNASFVNAKIDMEKGEGVGLAAKYEIRAYPTYIFVNGDGELVHLAMGMKPADKFIEDANDAKNPDKQFFTLKKRYEKGEKTPELLKNMSYAAQNNGDTELSAKASEAYLATQKDWTTKENMQFVLDFSGSIESKNFDYLLKNQAAFEKEFGQDKIQPYIERVGVSTVFGKFMNPQTGDFKQEDAKTYLLKYFPKETTERLLSFARLNIYQQKQDLPNFYKESISYFDKYPSKDAGLLNNCAWAFYETNNDKTQLEKALKWSLKSVEIDDSYAYNDTVAALYFKLGNKGKAKEFAQKAIKKAKETGDDPSETEAMLVKIEAMK